MNSIFYLFSFFLPWNCVSTIVLEPLPITLSVNIYLISHTDEYPLQEYNTLTDSLSTFIPSFSPPNNTKIQFKYNYYVKFLPLKDFTSYHNLISSSKIINGTVGLSSESLENYLLSLQKSLETNLHNEHLTLSSIDKIPIFLVLPSTKLPSHALYSKNIQLCSQTYTGSSIFIDLSSSICDFSYLIGDYNLYYAKLSTYSPFQEMYPPTRSTDPNNPSNILLTARILQVIKSALQSYSVLNDLNLRESFSVQRIVAPIVFLKSRHVTEQGKPAPGLSIGELKSLQNWIQSLLLPSQTISLLTATHYIEDHPQLSIAMASASRWTVTSSADTELDNPEPVPYLDSRSLLSELSQIGDNLCRRLMVDAGHGLEDDTLLQIEALFQSIEMKGEKLSKEDKITPDWVRQYTPTDDYDVSPRGPSHQRTQIVPVFVVSDLESTGFELMEENDQRSRRGIFPLFEDGHHVTSLESVALVLHSRNPSLTVYSKSMFGGFRSGIDISDASLSIAEILSRIIAGISPPFEVQPNGRRDLTWTLGTHPFSPYGYMIRSFISDHQQRGYSEIYSYASQRGIVLSRTLNIISEYLSIIQSAEELTYDLSKLYHTIIRPYMRLLPSSFTTKNSYSVTNLINPLSTTMKSEFLDIVFSPLAFLQYIEVNEMIPNTEIYLIPPEHRHMLQEIKTITHQIILEIINLYESIQQNSMINELSIVKKSEENLNVLRWNYYSSENRLKQSLDMCQIDPIASVLSSSLSKKQLHSTSKYLIVSGGIVTMVGLVFLVKYIQQSIENKVKKNK